MDKQGATNTTNSKIMPVNRIAGAPLSFINQYPTAVAAYSMMNSRNEHHRPPSPPMGGSFLLPNAKASSLPHANNIVEVSDHQEVPRQQHYQLHTASRSLLTNSWHGGGQIMNDTNYNVDAEGSLMRNRLNVSSLAKTLDTTHRNTLLDSLSSSSAHSQISSSLSSFVKPLAVPRHAELNNANSLLTSHSATSIDLLSTQQICSATDNAAAFKSNDSFNVVSQSPISTGTSSSAKHRKPLLKHLDLPAGKF